MLQEIIDELSRFICENYCFDCEVFYCVPCMMNRSQIIENYYEEQAFWRELRGEDDEFEYYFFSLFFISQKNQRRTTHRILYVDLFWIVGAGGPLKWHPITRMEASHRSAADDKSIKR